VLRTCKGLQELEMDSEKLMPDASPPEPTPDPTLEPTPVSATLDGDESSERELHGLGAVLQHVTVALFVVDALQRCLYINPAAEQMTGFSLAEMQGKPIHDSIVAQSREEERQRLGTTSIEQAISQNSHKSGRAVFQHKDGHDYPVAYTVSPIETKDTPRTLIEVRALTEEHDGPSEQRDRSFELSLNLLAIANFNGYFVQLNPAWEEVLGFSEAELKARHYLDFVHPEDRSATAAQAQRLTQGQDIVQFENRFCTKAGAYRWLLWSARPIKKDLFYAVAQDITERKLAEEALHERSARLRFMLDASKIGEWDLDLTTQPYTARRSLRHDQIFGYTSLLADWNYEKFLTHVHPDDRAVVDAKFQTTLSTFTDWDFECRIIHPDQSLHWIWAHGSIYRDASNTPVRLLGMVVDISDRKQAQQRLRDSEERYRILTEVAPQAVWTSQSNGYITYINQYWLEYMGLTFEAAAGYGWLAFLHPVDRTQVLTLWQQTANRSDSEPQPNEYEIEVRFRRPKDGAYRWFLVRGLPVYDDAGQIDRWIGAAINIHERKTAESAKEQLLEQEKTARAAAERANQIKDEFLAVLSHELRSPLNPILGWSQLLQQSDLDADTAAVGLKTIERNVQLQVQLIDDLLDISRILRGKLTLTVAKVELSNVVAAAFETVRLAAQTKDLDVRLSLAPALADGDEVRLQQVVWNLLSNAVKFTPQGGKIWITLSQIETYACIQVKDTGKGIDPDFIAHVFEHFRQEDGATTRKFGGLGLGLAIARQIVEMHGGTIAVNSPGEGQGATFTVNIPLAPQSSDLPDSGPLVADLGKLDGLQVLVIDDESDSRDFIVLALQQVKAIVTTASSAAEALQSIAQSVPDVLISDIGMPEMDGYTLIRQIRQLPPEKGGTIPAIALTAYASQPDREQVLEAGFQAHLAKPINPTVVISKIVQLVQSKQ
jgi:PAS domain S-box-containing protein